MKDDRVYLRHILDAIQDIEQYASVGRDAFMGDRMRQDALLRKLEVIGEAVKTYPKAPSSGALKFRGVRSQACATDSHTTISVWTWRLCGRQSRRTFRI